VLSVVTALFFGISTAFWFGTAMYGLAALSMVVLARQAAAGPPAAGDGGDDDAAEGAGGEPGTLVGASV